MVPKMRLGRQPRRRGSVRFSPPRWTVIDRVLAPFTADSVLAVLGAAVDTPAAVAWSAHLAPLWLRALRRPPHGHIVATADDVAQFAAVAARAAPGRPMVASRDPNDPRHVVGFSFAGRRWRIHPGDHEHPLMMLRGLASTARAVDEDVLQAFGFTFSDVVEVVLAHGHRTLARLGVTWPAAGATDADAEWLPVVSAAEIAAAAEVQAAGDEGLTNLCRHPQRAALVLAWLTRDARQVRARSSPFASLFGAVLFVRAGSRLVGVPASLTLDVMKAAAEAILRRVGDRASAVARMQALTTAHAHAFYSRNVVDRSAELVDAPFVIGPRTIATVTSALTRTALDRALDEAAASLRERTRIASPAEPAVAKVVVFGGPMVLGYQLVQDVVLLHIEEFVEILDDAGGDMSVVELFLEDLGHHRGFEKVEFLDLLDVWSAWRQYRRLGPAPREGDATVLRIRPDDRDLTWGNAVAWEPADAVLSAAGLPEHTDWPVSRLNAAFGADMFAPQPGVVVLVGVEPPVVIMLDAADGMPYGLDPDMLLGLADGIRGCLAGHPDVAGHARLAGGVPLRVVIRLLTEGPSDDDDSPWVRVAADPAQATLEIGFGVGVLEQFVGEGTLGHDTVGAALHKMIRRVRVERGEHPGSSAAAFLRGWRATGPITAITAVRESLPRTPSVNVLPVTDEVRGRALHGIFDLISQRGLAGTYTDAAAHQICQDHLIPVIEQRLRDLLAACRPELLRQLAVRLNAARAGHFQRRRQVDHALTRAWAANWHDAARDDDGELAVFVAQTLFELALAERPRGDRRADAMDAGELAALTDFLLTVAALDNGYHHGLHGLRVDIHPAGPFVVQPVVGTDAADQQVPGIDIDAYHRALRYQQIADATRPSSASVPASADDEPAGSPFRDNVAVPVEYRDLRAVMPPSLLAVDDQLAADRGAGIGAVAAVLSTAVAWPVGDDGITVATIEALVREAISWSGLGEDQIRAALGTLTLTPEALPAMQERAYLEVERREYRLPLRPLPVVDQQVWILPWVIHTTQRLYGGYLDSDRLPYPVKTLSDQATNAMTEHRKGSNTDLEHEVRAIVAGLRLPHRFQFNPSEMAKAGIANPIGEIDLLIADLVTRRLWICEVKDPIASFSHTKLRNHVRNFLHPTKGYVAKLLSKAGQIQQYARQATAACGVSDSGPWRVVPLIITRRVEPAAYANEPQVAFTLPRHLERILTSPDDPEPGAHR